MKRYRLTELEDLTDGHFLSSVLPGEYLCMGGMGFKAPGVRTHSNDGPGGTDLHVHADDREAFVILQGKAIMEIDGERHELTTGRGNRLNCALVWRVVVIEKDGFVAATLDVRRGAGEYVDLPIGNVSILEFTVRGDDGTEVGFLDARIYEAPAVVP